MYFSFIVQIIGTPMIARIWYTSGTNKEASIKKLMKLKSEPITEEQAEDIRRMNQSQCNNVGYEWEVEVWTPNHLKE